jgi:nickel-dependent lactate racemase
MHNPTIPYGKTHFTWPLDQYPSFLSVHPKDVPATANGKAEVARAIANAIGKNIEELKGAKKVVIVTSDSTRPVPNKEIFPPLLEALAEIGISHKQITVLIGTGLHRPAPPEEFPVLLGEDIAEKLTVISHDATDQSQLVHLGQTSRGTPIWINKHYHEADARILVGMIDPHQIVGISGGAKALAIGLGGEKLIQANHSMLTQPTCRLGVVDGNPARADIDEVGEIVGIDFIVNVILNNEKKIVKAVAGDFRKAHAEGIKLAQEICQVQVPEAADLVVASPGGYPKDINLYQAQKALAHAALVVKEGGVIILSAQCKEGVGEERFETTMGLSHTPQEVLERFAQSEFQMGAHKAFLWARSLAKAKVILISEGITDEMAKLMMVERVTSLDEALSLAKQYLPKEPKIILMPKASSTIPILDSKCI